MTSPLRHVASHPPSVGNEAAPAGGQARLVRMPTAGEHAARAICDLFESAVLLSMPDRHAEWSERRTPPRPDDLVQLDGIRERLFPLRFALEQEHVSVRLHVAVEGLRRIALRQGSSRNLDKFTGVVVHVVADGETVRTIIIPLEVTA